MKKFLKFGAVLTALFALLCFVACDPATETPPAPEVPKTPATATELNSALNEVETVDDLKTALGVSDETFNKILGDEVSDENVADFVAAINEAMEDEEVKGAVDGILACNAMDDLKNIVKGYIEKEAEEFVKGEAEKNGETLTDAELEQKKEEAVQQAIAEMQLDEMELNDAKGFVIYMLIMNMQEAEPPHEHTFATEWKSDATHHWHAATCEHTDEVSGKAEHTFGELSAADENGDKIRECTVCKYKETTHEHTFATEWTSDDETHHWHAATCEHTDEVSGKAEHTWDSGTVTTPATITSTGVMTYKCTVCQKEKTEAIPTLELATLLDNKVINGTTLEKTGEVAVITAATTVHMTDDSAWSGYVDSAAKDFYKGVFIKDRAVTLSPYAMGKYEVTQELYKAVLENDNECNATPSGCVETNLNYDNMYDDETQKLRPVETVTWYDAVYFCNALTKLTMSEDDCVYTITNIKRDSDKKYITSATVKQDLTKKGYRLPTEAEWEFAARGGDQTKPEWKYAFSGVNVVEGNMVVGLNSSDFLQYDDNLGAYAWYFNHDVGGKGYGTHEVGKKKANILGLYDMSGNVYEWCWDRNSDTVSTDAVTNPTGPASGYFRLARGGCWAGGVGAARDCAVSFRNNSSYPDSRGEFTGFRLARSL